MSQDTEVYQDPLVTRYASREMARIWSASRKYGLWRRMWVALARAQMHLGLGVTPDQVREMEGHLDDIDFDAAHEWEKRTKHDVMAHLKTFAQQCPGAAPIMHLGATSAFVTDNAEVLQIRESLALIRNKTAAVIDALGSFAQKYRDMMTLGYTHYQPAQLTTVGKRATLWAYELVMDIEELEQLDNVVLLRGAKGTTGTQASFLALFGGDREKVFQLDAEVARELELPKVHPVTGQTYTRKVDTHVVGALAGVAQSAHRFANDMRLLARERELEEPFGKEQVGSSAMPYKRNPMMCERMTALARYVMSLVTSSAFTAACQWLERTLDDSANRRLVLPGAFLATDAILEIFLKVARGIVVNERVVALGVERYRPFLATEAILMAAVQAGGNRQELHERIQRHSHAAAKLMKEEGRDNDLIDRLQADEAFAGVDVKRIATEAVDAGCAPEQVDRFVMLQVEPIRRRYADADGIESQVRV